jgi:XTP/dITP diphosphohydrolase
MKLCFATNNIHKLEEINALLGNNFEIVSLQAIGCREDLPENQDTLEGNSLEKAQFVWQHYQINCFADDTGLEVEALQGAPGVYSARYAGPQRNSQDNIYLLLQNLQNHTNRKARFRTSITLILEGHVHQFEGIVKGHIEQKPQGDKGFGYDPVFVPEGHTRTFAEMAMEEKSSMSHRGKAIEALVAFLKKKTENYKSS